MTEIELASAVLFCGLPSPPPPPRVPFKGTIPSITPREDLSNDNKTSMSIDMPKTVSFEGRTIGS